jgi:glycine/D-amino acid oxidase-like deaminating enzyme
MFCQWLRKQLELQGVKIITSATPQGLSINDQVEPQSLSINYKHGSSKHVLEFSHLVIAAGPWSQRVLSTLFPASEISIPFDLAHAAGNHLRVKAPKWKPEDDDAGCDQLYLAGILNHTLDISSYLGGTLYVGGYGGISETLPDHADDVKVQPAAFAAMKELYARTLNLAKDEAVEVIGAGRCYLPVVEMRRPIITKLPLERLLGLRKVPDDIQGAFYLNTGHGRNGITLGPGSGKVMSDLIYGREPAANILGLGLEP